ncbi:MAG: HNH endonuclease [Gallionella sp.]
MPTKPLDRLMFAQGGMCFFCKSPLPKSEASVEHLVASANGGSNNDENCVACCKAVNALLGSMSLKEKIQIVLNQRGQFKCPNGVGANRRVNPTKIVTAPKIKATEIAPKLAPKKTPASATTQEDQINLVIENFKQRGNSKPRKLKTLTSTLSSLFPKKLSPNELAALLQELQSSGMVTIEEGKVSYAL